MQSERQCVSTKPGSLKGKGRFTRHLNTPRETIVQSISNNARMRGSDEGELT